MYAKLLAYEIGRAVADFFGAFIAVIAVAAGIVAGLKPGISGSTAVPAYALCAPHAGRSARLRPWPTTGRPVRAARLSRDEPAGLWKGHLRAKNTHHDRVPPGSRPGCRRNASQPLRPPRGATVLASPSTRPGLFRRGRNALPITVGPHDRRAQIILAMSWVVQACAATTIGAEGRFNHMGFGAPIIGFVLLYIVNQVRFLTVGIVFPSAVCHD